MRNIVFRFDDPMGVAQTFRQADQELPLPAGETVRDGDYVVKPFRAPELGARIFALLRRARMATPGAGS